MFTGIIEKVGTLKAKKTKSDMHEVCIAVDTLWNDFQIGESIAVNGVCLTVTGFKKNMFFADASQPTLAVTTIGLLKKGAFVNIERALRIGDRLGGHWVQGHVDGMGQIKRIVKNKKDIFLHIGVSPAIRNNMVMKGSVAVDGVSVTIQEMSSDSFSVVIIPHTFKNTSFTLLKVNDRVNIEVDILSKYVKQHLKGEKSSLTAQLLQEEGF
ncbi:MAG: riboflavin synthase [Candidatus Omnitrophica bacterium]|nr:riboflavin synthase [Candidatus Omnitrophota bacterium]